MLLRGSRRRLLRLRPVLGFVLRSCPILGSRSCALLCCIGRRSGLCRCGRLTRPIAGARAALFLGHRADLRTSRIADRPVGHQRRSRRRPYRRSVGSWKRLILVRADDKRSIRRRCVSYLRRPGPARRRQRCGIRNSAVRQWNGSIRIHNAIRTHPRPVRIARASSQSVCACCVQKRDPIAAII